MGDRYNVHSQMEHLQSKYVGTGHSDTTKWEWLTHQHRYTILQFIGMRSINMPKTDIVFKGKSIPVEFLCEVLS